MNRGEKNIEDYKSLWHFGHVWTEEDKICTNAHKFHSILASGLAEPAGTLQHVHSQSPPRPAGHPTVPPAVYFKHQRNTEHFTVWVVPWNSSKMFPPRQCKIAETLTANCLSCLVPNNCLMRKLTAILGHAVGAALFMTSFWNQMVFNILNWKHVNKGTDILDWKWIILHQFIHLLSWHWSPNWSSIYFNKLSKVCCRGSKYLLTNFWTCPPLNLRPELWITAWWREGTSHPDGPLIPGCACQSYLDSNEWSVTGFSFGMEYWVPAIISTGCKKCAIIAPIILRPSNKVVATCHMSICSSSVTLHHI